MSTVTLISKVAAPIFPLTGNEQCPQSPTYLSTCAVICFIDLVLQQYKQDLHRFKPNTSSALRRGCRHKVIPLIEKIFAIDRVSLGVSTTLLCRPINSWPTQNKPNGYLVCVCVSDFQFICFTLTFLFVLILVFVVCVFFLSSFVPLFFLFFERKHKSRWVKTLKGVVEYEKHHQKILHKILNKKEYFIKSTHRKMLSKPNRTTVQFSITSVTLDNLG